MVTREERIRNRHEAMEKVKRVWDILVGLAANNGTITYTNLSIQVGFGQHPLACAKQLDAIYFYCLGIKLPPLPILVVNGRTGEPGPGFYGIDIPQETEDVWNFDWSSVSPPGYDDLFI